jgi:hypothetical protein
LIAAGTCAAIDALDVDVEAVVAELLELLLLPQPASATTTSAGAPIAATSFLI